jgi:hypothetical protein
MQSKRRVRAQISPHLLFDSHTSYPASAKRKARLWVGRLTTQVALLSSRPCWRRTGCLGAGARLAEGAGGRVRCPPLPPCGMWYRPST